MRLSEKQEGLANYVAREIVSMAQHVGIDAAIEAAERRHKRLSVAVFSVAAIAAENVIDGSLDFASIS